MRNQYVSHTKRWLLVWLMGPMLSAQAQTTQPVQLQWQRVVEGVGLTQTSRVQAAKTTNGYGVLTDKNLIRLSLTGDVIWNKAVPGSYADSTTNRIPNQQTVALTSAPAGGFVVLGLDVNSRYYLTKLDSAGQSVWTKTVSRPGGSSAGITANALSSSTDGGFLVVGSYRDKLSYLTMTKLSSEGYIVGQWRVTVPNTLQSSTLLISQVLPVFKGGYLLVGQAAGSPASDSKGVAIQVDAQYNVTWQQLYPTLSVLQDVQANPDNDGTYTAIGSGVAAKAQVITIAPNKAGDGNLLYTLPGSASAVSLVNNGPDNVTTLDAVPGNNGDFRLTNTTLPTSLRWTKNLGGSGTDGPGMLLATADGGYLAVGTTTSTDGDVVGKSNSTVAAWILKLGNAPRTTTLQLLAPTYDCTSGVVLFNTTGGDGSPITYAAPGITRKSSTDNVGLIEQGLRNDPKIIMIQATQQGQTVSYAFDFEAYCRNSQPSSQSAAASLQLIAPTYNCATGAITFHATGGDGSRIDYAAPGITDWSSNPSQFVDPETRTAYDAPPLILMARQNGRVVTYVFDIKAACGRARTSTVDSASGLVVTVLENPTQEIARVQITGVGGKPVRMELVDSRGRAVEQRTIQQAGTLEQQTFDLRQQAEGIFLLHTTAEGQTRTVKMLRQ